MIDRTEACCDSSCAATAVPASPPDGFTTTSNASPLLRLPWPCKHAIRRGNGFWGIGPVRSTTESDRSEHQPRGLSDSGGWIVLNKKKVFLIHLNGNYSIFFCFFYQLSSS